jgi:hypothetical protein
MLILLNLNEIVHVNLTERGVAVWNEYASGHPGLQSSTRGYITVALRDIIAAFGSCINDEWQYFENGSLYVGKVPDYR